MLWFPVGSSAQTLMGSYKGNKTPPSHVCSLLDVSLSSICHYPVFSICKEFLSLGLKLTFRKYGCCSNFYLLARNP